MARRTLKLSAHLPLQPCCSLFVLLLSAGALAQPSTSQSSTPVILDPVVVTATVSPTTVSETLTGVTVITRAEIEASRARSVTELLRQIPGLHIDQPGGRGSVSSVYVRGGDPNFTAVLIDGVKVNDPTNSRGGSFDFATLDVDSIERIEVVRGPLSSVYGSDAVSGVINILTERDAHKSEKDIEVTGGESSYGRIFMRARGRQGSLDYGVSVSNTDNGMPVEGSAFRGKALNVNVGHALSDTMEMRSTLRYAASHLESFPDDSGGPEFAVLRTVDKRDADELVFGFDFLHEVSDRWNYNLRLGLYDRFEDISSPGVAPGIRDPIGIPPNISDNRYRRASLNVRNTISLNRRLRLGVGAELESESGDSEGNLLIGAMTVPTSFELQRNNWATFVEAEYAFIFGLVLRAGVRFDEPEDFGSELSPSAGVSYTLPSNRTTLRASWGEGFKLPSFFALGNPIVGNRALLPEVSHSRELGLRTVLRDTRVTVDMALFSSEVRNAVDLDEGPPPVLVNRSKISARGLEASVRATASDNMDVSAQLSHVKTDIADTDEELRNRPEWRGGIGVLWQPRSSVQVQLDILYVGEILDSSIPTGDRRLGSYTRVNLATTWQPNRTWGYFVIADNLLDAAYEEAIGFPAAGRRLRIGARASF